MPLVLAGLGRLGAADGRRAFQRRFLGPRLACTVA